MKRLVASLAFTCFVLWGAGDTGADEIDRDVIGGWQLKMTTPDGQAREPMVLIGRQYDRYAAWYVGDDGLEPLSKVKLDGDTLTGSITPKEQPDVRVKLSARLTDKDTCQGVGEFESANGDQGEWSFTGEKSSTTRRWANSKTGRSSSRRPTTKTACELYVMPHDGNYYAWFEGKDHDLPAPVTGRERR